MARTRLELKLTEDRKRDLTELADEMGCSVSDVMRLAATRLLADRARLTGRPPAEAAAR